MQMTVVDPQVALPVKAVRTKAGSPGESIDSLLASLMSAGAACAQGPASTPTDPKPVSTRTLQSTAVGEGPEAPPGQPAAATDNGPFVLQAPAMTGQSGISTEPGPTRSAEHREVAIRAGATIPEQILPGASAGIVSSAVDPGQGPGPATVLPQTGPGMTMPAQTDQVFAEIPAQGQVRGMMAIAVEQLFVEPVSGPPGNIPVPAGPMTTEPLAEVMDPRFAELLGRPAGTQPRAAAQAEPRAVSSQPAATTAAAVDKATEPPASQPAFVDIGPAILADRPEATPAGQVAILPAETTPEANHPAQSAQGTPPRADSIRMAGPVVRPSLVSSPAAAAPEAPSPPPAASAAGPRPATAPSPLPYSTASAQGPAVASSIAVDSDRRAASRTPRTGPAMAVPAPVGRIAEQVPVSVPGLTGSSKPEPQPGMVLAAPAAPAEGAQAAASVAQPFVGPAPGQPENTPAPAALAKAEPIATQAMDLGFAQLLSKPAGPRAQAAAAPQPVKSGRVPAPAMNPETAERPAGPGEEARAELGSTRDSSLPGQGEKAQVVPATPAAATAAPTATTAYTGNTENVVPTGAGMHQTASPQSTINQDSTAIRLPSGAVVPEQKVIEQIISQVSTRVLGSGVSSITLRLQPEELGRLKMELLVDKGAVKAHIQAASTQVQEVLERYLPRLRESFEQSGLRLEQIQVNVDAGRSRDSGPFQDHQFLDHGPFKAPTRGTRINVPEAAMAGPLPLTRGAGGGINLRV